MSVSAAFYISVDGGANQSGGVEVTSGQSVQFIPVSVVGWLRARYEIYDYPEGWPTPAGWTLDGATGRIYNEDVSALGPDPIVMPENSDYWGIWMPRLMVNEQLDTDEEELEGLLDDENAICLLSPSGLRDCGAREGQHFTTATTRVKNWLRSYQRNLRALENPSVGTTSTEVTPVVIRRYPVATGGVKVLRAVVKVRNAAGTIYGEYEVKGAWNRAAGTLAQLYAPTITTIIESDAGLNVTITLDGNDAVLLNGVGLAATNLTWEAQEAFF